MKNIILIGFMGTGKTTIGKRTAAKLGIEFYDTDAYIQKCENMPVFELLKKKGPKYFEGAERFAVSTLSQNEGCLISTGGDTVLDPFNLESLQKNGLLFWLKANPETIYKNTRFSAAKRPGLDRAGLEEIAAMMAQRELHYKKADAIICVDHNTVDEAADEIIAQFKSLLN